MSIIVDRNQAGNTVTFSGTGVAASGVHPNACLTPRINADDPDTVDIVNNHRRSASPGAPGEFLEYRGIHFSEFQDVDGNTFGSAADVVAFLESVCSAPSVGELINEYDVYVTSGYTSGLRTGTVLQPFNNVQDAIDAAGDGARIFVNGEFAVTSPLVLPSDKTLYFHGTERTAVGYATYDASNGDVFVQSSTGSSAEYSFSRLTIRNAGGYGIHVKSAAKVSVTDCTLVNNGWDGTALSTVSPETAGTLGYDSSQAELQAFYASSHASDGGALRLESVTQVEVTANTVTRNLRGIRVQDCGVGGYGFITRNVASQNIESGIYLAAGSAHSGCQNIVTSMNSSAYNANNGLLVVGGLNNKFSQNEVNGNWNAGFCAWGAANSTLRDCGLYDNNRSEFNGVGNTGDARASIQINEAYDLLGTNISLDPAARFIAEVLDTQVHYTGLGSSTERIGLLITEDVGLLADDAKNIIKVDDVGFIGQDYAIDLSEVDVTNLRVTLGDNSYISIGEKAVRPPLAGEYYELPFSNHVTGLKQADFSVDATGNVIIREGVAGARLNPYKVNDLHAVASGPDIKVLLKDSDKIQFTVPVSGSSIGGVSVNSVLSLALVQLNNLFTNTAGFSSGGNPVTGFVLVGNSLTLTLQDNTSFTVDVTTLGVDEDKFVASGALDGTDLVLTMNDASTVTIDALNMVNGSQLPAIANSWYIAYGVDSGDQVTSAGIVASIKDKQPFYNGDVLEKGHEYLFTHDGNGSYMVGVWTGAAGATDEASALSAINWTPGFRFVRSTGRISGTESSGVDISTRLTAGDSVNVTADGQYDVTNSTALALRYGNDNYLYLLDVSGDDAFVIGRSSTVLAGDSVQVYFAGENQPNAKLPVMVERPEVWTIVHDYDSSENGEWNNGVEADTVIRSNVSISPGEKTLLNFNYFGRSESVGLGYTGASTGQNNAYTGITFRLFYNSAELFKAADTGASTGGDWTWNTGAVHYYDPVGDGSNVGYYQGAGVNLGLISFRYLTDNSVEIWHEGHNELIATKSTLLDGSPLTIHMGFNEAHPSQRIPSVSKQLLSQGSQPPTDFAPDISDQSFDITEGQAFNVQIALDSGSDIVNQYGESDAPSWAILGQATGALTGTAPAYTGTSDSYVISCKAGNVLGGVTNFDITLNVVEPTYTNTTSLFFEDAVQSYLGGNAALVTALERSSNGAGSGDAWTVAFWYKGSTNNQAQTLFYFGNNDVVNNGHIELRQTNHNGLKRIRLRYGSNGNHLQLTTPSGSISPGTWQHIVVTYDGGTTGSGSGSMAAYYSRFKIFIDGVEQTTSNTHSNFGYANSVVGQNYRFGRLTSGNYPRDAYLNQLCIWGSDQSTNIAGIYNGGATQDMTDSTTMDGAVDGTYAPPDHYYEITNSVSTVPDINGTAHFVGYNFSSSDLVTDTP